MPIIQILLSLVVIIATACHAFANDAYGYYIAPRVLFSLQEISADTTLLHQVWGPKKIYATNIGASLALGYDFQPRYAFPVRIELEYGAFEHISKQGKARILRKPVELRAKLAKQTLLANAYIDIPTSTAFTPFFGGGMGVAFIQSEMKSSLGTIKKDSTVFAGQIGAGCAYSLTSDISIDLGYRFLMTGKTSQKSPSIHLNYRKNNMHQALLGLRMTF